MPNSQEMALNFEKFVLQRHLRITFYTYIPLNPYHFSKKIIMEEARVWKEEVWTHTLTPTRIAMLRHFSSRSQGSMKSINPLADDT